MSRWRKSDVVTLVKNQPLYWISEEMKRSNYVCLSVRVGESLVHAVMSLRASQNAGNFLTIWGPLNFSERSLILGVI
jgi:hypothetical protein